MAWLGEREDTIFVGQGVGCAGTTLTDTLRSVPKEKLLEFPVAEDLQTGFCTGLALQGYLPICIYPRWNFLICATNQIVNHLDRLPLIGAPVKCILRVAVPITHPFNPGPQHDDDFTHAFRSMLRRVEVVTLEKAEDVFPAYQRAVQSSSSSLMVEYTGLYNTVPSGVPDKEGTPN